jgi:hypothetical protein
MVRSIDSVIQSDPLMSVSDFKGDVPMKTRAFFATLFLGLLAFRARMRVVDAFRPEIT